MMDVFAKAIKSDPEGAAVLLDQVAISYGMSLIETHREEFTKALLEEMDVAVRVAKAGLTRSYVSKAASGQYPEQDTLLLAEWLGAAENYLIEKSSLLEDWLVAGQNRKRKVARDALGRFASVNGSGKQGVVNTTSAPDAKLYAPIASRTQNVGGVVRANQTKDTERLDKWQKHAANAQDRASKWRDTIGAKASDSAEVEFTLEGTNSRPRVRLTDVVNGDFPSSMDFRHPISGMRLSAAATASEDEAKLIESKGGLNLFGRLTDNSDRNAALFASRGDMSRTKAAMTRLGIVGDLLQESDVTAKYGAMASLVGSLGPEAAQILDPHVRRTAYRYRGTERTIDRNMRIDLENPDLVAISDSIDHGQVSSAKEIGERISDNGKDLADPVMQSVKYRTEVNPNASGDALKLGVRSDVAAAALLQTLPKNALIGELSLKSGHVLPSQGVLIDADGDPISQSVGFGEDHYLPFNLKNMGRARGGQYIRTRQQGGLTGEDIFASVAHGVRSATVASSSGVFRLEFAPDFRGARGNSDKAFSMTERYLKILDTLQAGGLHAIDLPAAEQAKIWSALRNDRRYADKSDKELRRSEEFEAAKEKARRAKLNEVDPNALRTEIEDEVNTSYPRASIQQRARLVDERFTERYNEELDARIKVLDLNGEGYALALKTLQAQFPYFIRSVEFEELKGRNDADAQNRRDSPAVFAHGRPDMGFFARRGLRYSSGPKQSRGVDAGYVQRGSLTRGRTRAAAAPDVVATQAEQQQATVLPGQVSPAPPTPKANDAGVARPAVTVTAPVPQKPLGQPSTSSATARLATLQAKADQDQVDEILTDLVAEFGGIRRQLKGLDPTRFKPSDSLTGGWNDQPDDKTRLAWLLSADNEQQMFERFEEGGELAFELLTDPKTVDRMSQAFGVMFENASIKDIVDENDAFGAESPKEFANAVLQRAIAVSELGMLSEPFVDERTLDTTTARAIDFSDITGLGSPQEVDRWEDANTAVAATAERLLFDSLGQQRRFSEVSHSMEQARLSMEALRAGMDSYAAAGSDAERKAEANNFARRNGTAFAAHFLAPLGITTAADKEDFIISVLEGDSGGMLDKGWEQLQRARTLSEVKRIHAVEMGGGARPKLLSKASPRLRRVNQQDPISKAAASRRVAASRRRISP